MAPDAQQKGWEVLVCLVEIGCRGFVATKTIRLLKELGIPGQALHKFIKEIATVALDQA